MLDLLRLKFELLPQVSKRPPMKVGPPALPTEFIEHVLRWTIAVRSPGAVAARAAFTGDWDRVA